MKYIVYTLLAIALVLFFAGAHADVVLACDSPWGSSGSCGGCTGLAWKTPAPTLNVKTTASDFWTKLSALKSTDTVYTNAAKKDGDAVVCSEATPISLSILLSGSPVVLPSPPPAPPPTVQSQCLSTGCGITWTQPTLNVDGSPIGPILNYLLNVNRTPQNVGNVLAYTFIKPAGNYTITLQTVTADGTSDPTNPVTAVVVAPVASGPILTKTPGRWVLMKGSTNIQKDLATEADCEKAILAKATATATTYSCNLSDKYSVKQ